jgi:hypothetical protein
MQKNPEKIQKAVGRRADGEQIAGETGGREWEGKSRQSGRGR